MFTRGYAKSVKEPKSTLKTYSHNKINPEINMNHFEIKPEITNYRWCMLSSHDPGSRTAIAQASPRALGMRHAYHGNGKLEKSTMYSWFTY